MMILRKFQHLSVRAKLSSTFGLLIFLMCVVAASALLALQEANSRFIGYVHGLDARATVAGHISDAVNRRAIAARNLVLAARPEEIEAERKRALEAAAEVAANMDRLRGMLAMAADASPRAHTLFAAIDEVERSYGPVAAEIVELATGGQRDTAIRGIQERCRPLLDALVKATAEYVRFTDERAHELTEDAADRFTHQRTLVVALCVVALAAAAAGGYFITRNITTGLGGAVRAADTIATGDLSQAIVVHSADETGQLLAALGQMQACLNGTVASVRANAESVAAASAQIAQGNHDLSHRTEEQASALQQTAASMEQLSQAVRHNADSAQQADALATRASDIAGRCGAAVAEVVQTMRQIQQSSHRINDIVGVIDSIAFQTNILALNAAVEAARAGEQGRGFGVVAGEVRTLATRSADAAREIRKLIASSTSDVERGASLSDGAGDTVREVVAAIRRVSGLIGEISSASREQSAGVGQVGAAINVMDDATQRNAALVEESAAAASSLQAQAERLLAAVAIFRQGPVESEVPLAQSPARAVRSRPERAPGSSQQLALA